MEMEAEITDSESTATSLTEKIKYYIQLYSALEMGEELQTVDTNLQFEGLNTTLHIKTAAISRITWPSYLEKEAREILLTLLVHDKYPGISDDQTMQ